MARILLFIATLVFSSVLVGQDDIYDQPEPLKPRVVYSSSNNNPNLNNHVDGSYENLDDSYNPDYDYRYRRSLRRMYDPYYLMPSSAFLNMYTYPQFSNFYNPYWSSGFTISIGNTWGSPWGWNNGWNTWNNPWGWNSWNSWHAWNNPWGWNNWGGGWNNGWCGWNNWGGGWNDPYWGGGWNSWGGGWNNPRWAGNSGRSQRSNYTDVSGRRAYSNAQLPQRNYPRANGRYQNPNNAGSTFGGNPTGNQGRGTNVNPTPSQPPSSGNSDGGVFGGGRSGSRSNQNSNTGSNNNSSWGGGSITPSAPASTPSPSRGSAPRGGRF
jgi:hypothetical protein